MVAVQVFDQMAQSLLNQNTLSYKVFANMVDTLEMVWYLNEYEAYNGQMCEFD